MKETIDFIKSKTDIMPEVGLVLGSGLGDLADEIKGVRIPYSQIPGFANSSVQGHKGQLVIGEFCNKKVVAMQGRFHFYEGYSLEKVVYPIKVMKKLGVKNLIVTNAAGGINESFRAGDLMIIKDHINFMGTNPLIGKNDETLGPRFPDMSEAYDKNLIKNIKETAQKLNIKTQEGIYIGCTGPSYETPSEVKMLRILGADAVGMSTVPEVITANYLGIKILGISCITNMACGILNQPLDHKEVIDTANKVKKDFARLLKDTISVI